jgi:hypothetical protein
MSQFNFMQMGSMLGSLGSMVGSFGSVVGSFGEQGGHHGHHHQGGFGGQQGQLGQQGQGQQGPIGQLFQEIQQLEQQLQQMLGGGGQQQGMGGMGDAGQMGGMGMGSGMEGQQNPFQSTAGPSFGCPSSSQQSPWTVTNTGSGQDQIDLGNYTLSLNKSNSQWTLTNKQTGETTNVSGDPHVADGSQHFDFHNDTTFNLPDGTKITCKTVPAGNGATLSSELDISRGGQGMKISNLASNEGGGLQVTPGLNGWALSASNIGLTNIYDSNGSWVNQQGQPVTNS